jgi:hypothetical protein
MPRVDVGPKSPGVTPLVPLRVRPRERLKLAEGGDDVTFDPHAEPAPREVGFARRRRRDPRR